MKKNTNFEWAVPLFMTTVIAAAAGYAAGKTGDDKMTDQQRFLIDALQKKARQRYDFKISPPQFSERTLINQRRKLEKEIAVHNKKREAVREKQWKEHNIIVQKIRREILFGDVRKALKMIDGLPSK